mmetsp:Transcript_11419/g.28132  ORF Transcript_11419/g.28132 Transcript_11419/m.28132 type:complete len:269 (-) Transcript_11419:69-875(-)
MGAAAMAWNRRGVVGAVCLLRRLAVFRLGGLAVFARLGLLRRRGGFLCGVILFRLGLLVTLVRRLVVGRYNGRLGGVKLAALGEYLCIAVGTEGEILLDGRIQVVVAVPLLDGGAAQRHHFRHNDLRRRGVSGLGLVEVEDQICHRRLVRLHLGRWCRRLHARRNIRLELLESGLLHVVQGALEVERFQCGDDALLLPYDIVGRCSGSCIVVVFFVGDNDDECVRGGEGRGRGDGKVEFHDCSLSSILSSALSLLFVFEKWFIWIGRC